MKDKKEAVEEIRRLANQNYSDKEVEVEIDYDNCLPKAEESLLIENK